MTNRGECTMRSPRRGLRAERGRFVIAIVMSERRDLFTVSAFPLSRALEKEPRLRSRVHSIRGPNKPSGSAQTIPVPSTRFAINAPLHRSSGRVARLIPRRRSSVPPLRRVKYTRRRETRERLLFPSDDTPFESLFVYRADYTNQLMRRKEFMALALAGRPFKTRCALTKPDLVCRASV